MDTLAVKLAIVGFAIAITMFVLDIPGIAFWFN